MGMKARKSNWVKIPKENHPIFYSVMNEDPRTKTIKMFGGIAQSANGYMFAGLFANTIMLRLGEKDLARLIAMPGASPFDPMGHGRPFKEMALVPPEFLQEPAKMRRWIQKAFDYSMSLPPKAKKPKKSKKNKTKS